MPDIEKGLLAQKHKFRARTRLFIFTVAAVTIAFAIYPTLGGQILANGSEVQYTLLRIDSICEGWNNGYFPVRVNPRFFAGYGLGASLTSPDLFLWIPAFLRYNGMDMTTGYNIFLCLCVIACWCTVYKTAKDITGSRYGGLTAAALVTLSQYFTNVLYFRASYEDYLSFIFIPVVILGLYDMFYRGYKKPGILFAGMLGMFCSSIRLFGMMCVFILVFFCIYAKTFKKNPRFLGIFGLTLVLLALVTCTFWLPYIEQTRYIDFATATEIDWQSSAVGINRLIANTQSVTDGTVVSASFGAVLILLTFVRAFVRRRDDTANILPLADKLLILGYVCLFLSSSIFPIKFWWILEFVGYPARFYVFAVVFFSVAIGIYLNIGLHGRRFRSVALYAIIAVSVIVSLGEADARNVSYITYINRYFKNDSSRTYSVNETTLIPEDTETSDYFKGNSVFFNDGTERYITARSGTTIEFSVDGGMKYADLPLTYYYGYVAEYVDEDGNTQSLKIDGEGENNVCRVYISKLEKGTVRVWYKPTDLQNISLIVTVCSCFAIAGACGLYYSRKKQLAENPSVL